MPECIWIHAVSVGESMAAAPLIEKLYQHYPQKLFLITTTTPTAYFWTKKNLHPNITHAFLPYDYPFLMKRFIAHFNPKISIIMETELWPNLMHQLDQKKIPIILANARLSKKSYQGYRAVKPLTRTMLKAIHHVLAQSQPSATHLIQLGLSPRKLSLSQNLKFTPKIPDIDLTIQNKIKQQAKGPCWIAASTHAGEESIALDSHKKILEKQPNATLILAPRHPERVDEVRRLIKERQLSYDMLSHYGTQTVQVLLIDTIGDLMQCFPLTQAALIGGSIVPHGGHNLIEPLLFNIPVITGPHMHNFQAIWEDCMHSNLCKTLENQDHLAHWVLEKFTTDSHDFKTRCQQFVQQQSQGLDQHIAIIKEAIDVLPEPNLA